MKPIKRIIKIIVDRLGSVAPLEEYSKIYPDMTKKYIIWKVIAPTETMVFGAIVEGGKVKFIEDVIVDFNIISQKFMNDKPDDTVEGIIEITSDAVMDLLLGRADIFACEFMHKNINLLSARRNRLRSLLYLMFSEQKDKVLQGGIGG